ncbi:lipopolysaccharide biosynthesis protein [Pelotomaculum propionicicum]|uniref:lipopolysaccharide biosynthesis protein n=1 Tax=Pelotomaculum propionicicum TaxID=258475 RepID=UPI003B793191
MKYRNAFTPAGWKKIRQHLKDPLYINSFFMALSRFLNASGGFIFWLLAARLYSKEDVGLTSALFSYLELVLLFSVIGTDFLLIRYLPIYDKKKVFNTCLSISISFSLITGVFFVLGCDFFSAGLSVIKSPYYFAMFVLFGAANTFNQITGTTFIAMRQSANYFLQNLIRSVRIPLLIPLFYMGSLGIFQSLGIACILSSLFSLYLLGKNPGLNFKIDKNFIKKTYKFSLYHYFANNLSEASMLIIPIMVFNLLGKVEAANYYIASAIGDLVLIIPGVLGTSLFVEGSHGENTKNNLVKAIKVTYALLIPIIFIIYLYGNFFLGLFGESYMESYKLLCLISISSLLTSIYTLFVSILRIKMKMGTVLKLNMLMSAILLGLSYMFSVKYGLAGVGYARIVTSIIIAVVIAVIFKQVLREESQNPFKETSASVGGKTFAE